MKAAVRLSALTWYSFDCVHHVLGYLDARRSASPGRRFLHRRRAFLIRKLGRHTPSRASLLLQVHAPGLPSWSVCTRLPVPAGLIRPVFRKSRNWRPGIGPIDAAPPAAIAVEDALDDGERGGFFATRLEARLKHLGFSLATNKNGDTFSRRLASKTREGALPYG